MADSLAIGLRALAFVAVIQAAGVPLFVSLFGESLDRAARPITALGPRAAAIAILLTLAHALAEPARLAGELHGILDISLQRLLLASSFGTTTAIRVLGLTLVAAAQPKLGRPGRVAALVGGVLVVVSFAFMGHTAADEQRWLLAPMLVAHLLLVAFWFGALGPLLMAARYEALERTGLLVRQFSELAIWLVPVVFGAGLVLAVSLLPDLASLQTPYGLLLLSKVAAFAVLMGVAAINKWRLSPRIERGEGAALAVFRRTVQIEWLLIAGVLCVTALMTGLFSPTP